MTEVPSRNSTEPVTPAVLLSVAPTVAVKVSEAPSPTLLVVADSAVVVAVCATWTTVVDDVEVAYELLVGLKTAVMELLPPPRALVAQVAVPTPGEPEVPAPVTDVGSAMQSVIAVVPSRNST